MATTSKSQMCDVCTRLFGGHWEQRIVSRDGEIENDLGLSRGKGANTVDNDPAISESGHRDGVPPIPARPATQQQRRMWQHRDDHSTKFGNFRHHNISGLKNSAAHGCHLCNLLLDQLPIFQTGGEGEFHETWKFAEDNPQKMFGIASILPHGETEDSSGLLRLDVLYFLDGDISKKGIRPCWISLYLLPIFAPESILSDVHVRTLPQVDAWVSQCRESHSECKAVSYFPLRKPARLINIESQSSSIPLLQIVDGSTIPKDAEYITLSHRWGGTRMPVLRNENEAMYRRSISWELLTNTFRDAVSYTQALGVKYLWIDAFCINQDKFIDWLEEALSMASIFSNALVNIAATCSSDGDGGLFSASNPFLSRAFTVKTRWAAGFPARQYAAFDGDAFHTRVESAVLNHRAWVLQERLLSPRTVHFAADQIYWECRHLRANETWPAGIPFEETGAGSESIIFKRLTPDSEDQTILRSCWRKIVGKYSGCLLTEESDKLIAVAGLAQVVQQYMGCPATDYLAGFWRHCLGEDLLWSTETRRQERYETYHAPSWSWASVKGSVDWKTPRPHFEASESYSWEVKSANVQLIDAERHFGPVLSGYIEVVASLCRAELGAADKRQRRLEYLTINGRRFTCDDTLSDILDDHRLYRQIPEWSANHTAYVCRVSTMDSRLEEGLWESDGLLLERSAHLDQGTYKRLGWVRLFHREAVQEFAESCLLATELNRDEFLWREVDGRYGFRII
ncbi:hypothetical protein PV08_04135 [Exophiala spinifera]|uniref:Heterokaryon incompatibility domain-containing protein n=1 Tax=Exophiala spinifera TaxID=91928 RepID=A0A0D2BEC5_9EURO|nr:uncharacterized protein PV08_04135 [Exophiala spinifera]KIW16945.1 hypothetical protein PV08_04135 [Exophiala spinifera]